MTTYTEAEWRKIVGPKAEFITDEQARELLSLPSGSRPRIYGLSNNQIVKVASITKLDESKPERVWLSHTTIADLIGRA